MITTASGLQYEDTVEGNGELAPQSESQGSALEPT